MTNDVLAGEGEAPLRVSTLELFFDLVFVFAITQLTSILSHDVSVAAGLRVLLIFGVLWWMYGGYVWLANARTPSRTTERLLMLAGMAGFLIMGLAIPEAFGRDGVALGIGYLVVVTVHAWLYQRVNRNIARVVPFNLLAAVLVIVAGIVKGPAGYVLWAIALAAPALSPLIIKPRGRFSISPSHFTERHGALVIIVFGESVVDIGIGAEGHPVTVSLALSAVLGLALTAALWWAYFGAEDDERAEQAMVAADPAGRPALALAAYFYAYIPILLGIVALASGVKQAIVNTGSTLPAGPCLALGWGGGGQALPREEQGGSGGDRSLRDNRAMIERYTLPEMGRVWSEAHKYELWCRVETLVLAAHARAGTVPAESVEPVRSAPPPTPDAVAAVEAVTDHDVIAFLTAWADNTTPRSAAAWVHYGMTSSDLLDTALAVQLAEASDLLVAKATRLVAVLRDHALAHRDTLRPGRTHGIHAEPDTWGHRVADFAFAMARARDRLARARDAVAVGTLSGPVGTYSNIDPAIEAEVMAALELRAADVATQVVMRDGIAEWVSALALAATVGEAVALEVRHGQRTEVRELAEPFRAGQKGSSAMPHKKNPIRSERICGLARVIRGYVTPVTEGIPLWHERDISHSSTERVFLPDAAITTDYLLNLTAGLVEGLVVDVARMRANLDLTGGLMYSAATL